MKKTLYCYLLVVFLLTACGGGKPAAAVTAPATQAIPPTAAPGVTVPSPDSPAGAAPIVVPTDSAVVIVPTDSAPVVVPSNPSDCADRASFVADVTVPDNQLFQPGQEFNKIWRVKNAGTCAWTNQYTLVLSKNDQIKAPVSSPLQEIPPGNTLDISVTMAAPSDENVTRARADFEIRNPNGAAIPIDTGSSLWVIIQVANGEAPKQAPIESGGPGYAAVTCGYTINPSKINEVFAALNAYRAQQGLPPYILNARLSEAAQAHSADMACNSLFYHNGSNGSTPKSRVAASGYTASTVTENVYGSYPPLSAAELISWWATDTTDPRHNENLLSVRYIEVGIGYAYYNNFGYCVIDFAAP